MAWLTKAVLMVLSLSVAERPIPLSNFLRGSSPSNKNLKPSIAAIIFVASVLRLRS